MKKWNYSEGFEMLGFYYRVAVQFNACFTGRGGLSAIRCKLRLEEFIA
jgi:hypothetical protein